MTNLKIVLFIALVVLVGITAIVHQSNHQISTTPEQQEVLPSEPVQDINKTEVVYPISWSASKTQRESKCGNITTSNRADLDSNSPAKFHFNCEKGETYNLSFYMPYNTRGGIIKILYNRNQQVGSCEVMSGFSGQLQCTISCLGEGEYYINSTRVIYICAGDISGSYCDWANNPEECERNCQDYDYCKPPYLVKVS